MVTPLLFLISSAICNAIMDNIVSYDTFGIYFKRKNLPLLKEFFERESWDNKYQIADWMTKALHIPAYISLAFSKQILVMFSDAWHFFKILMLLSFVGIVVTFDTSIFHVSIITMMFGLWLAFSILFSIFFKLFQLINK